MTEKTCAVPDCGNTFWDRNTTGVCRDHAHAKPFCQCIQCATGRHKTYRVKTRAEMVEEGLLPKRSTAARPPEFIDQITALCKTGTTLFEAARKLGLTPLGLTYYEKKLGVKFKRPHGRAPDPPKATSADFIGPKLPMQLFVELAAQENGALRKRCGGIK